MFIIIIAIMVVALVVTTTTTRPTTKGVGVPALWGYILTLIEEDEAYAASLKEQWERLDSEAHWAKMEEIWSYRDKAEFEAAMEAIETAKWEYWENIEASFADPTPKGSARRHKPAEYRSHCESKAKVKR